MTSGRGQRMTQMNLYVEGYFYSGGALENGPWNLPVMGGLNIIITFVKIIIMKKGGYVYILTNKNKTVLYTGVTNSIKKRTYQHKFERGSIFTSRYNVTNLIYYDFLPTIVEAIAREKAIKNMSREKKEKLINSFNPTWDDLYEMILDQE